MKRIRAVVSILQTFTVILIYPTDADLHRQVWIGSQTGDPYWKEGDDYPTESESVNRFLHYTEVTYNAMLHAGGHLPSWDSVMFGVVDSEFSDLQGLAGPCTYGDAYFAPDSFENYGSVFCPDMVTPFWVGHEWGHGYAQQSGSLLGQDYAKAGTIFEFLADVVGMTVQFLALELLTPSPEVIPYNKFRHDGECSTFGENTGFSYIQGSAGLDESKRWLVGTECPSSPACPSRDMWNPTCFGAPDTTSSPNYLCHEDIVDKDDEESEKVIRIHKNNGVGNRFFALLVDGSASDNVESIGLRKAVRIVMDAMVRDSNQDQIPQGFGYPDLALALEQSCQNAMGQPLYDLLTGALLDETVREIDCNQVAAAIAAVEMTTEPCPNDPEPDLPIVALAQGNGSNNNNGNDAEDDNGSNGKGVRGSKIWSMVDSAP